MHALIVVAHPHTESLTHGVAGRLADGVSASGHTHEIADLSAEGFDPRFTQTDLRVHLRESEVSPDVFAEQQRIDRAEALVLVYPVYWWSMPGLLKGWIDRVFTNGWAYDSTPDTSLVKRLRGRKVTLVAIGAADAGTLARHGFDVAMKTQIEHGIFDYCGAEVVASYFLHDSHGVGPTTHLDTAYDIGRQLFSDAPAQGIQPADAATA